MRRIPWIARCWKIDYRGSLCPGWPCRFSSDDIVALVEREGTFQVLPAYPHLCLWPDSVNMLYGSPDALPRFCTNWEKRRLALGKEERALASRALPLCAIYLLGDRRSDFAPCVESVRAQAALLSLVAETYANKILDREMRAREFEVLSRLVSAVPVRRVQSHENANPAGELCKVIREDLDSLKLPRSAWLDCKRFFTGIPN